MLCLTKIRQHMQLHKGILIAIEGIDGSGKSSLIASIATRFQKKEIPFITTKEPGGSLLGKHIRILLNERPVPITAKAEYLLFAADRSQHFAEIIEPALAKKKLVLADRLGDSSLIYQGYGRDLNLDKIRIINMWAMNNRTPDLTIYIHIDIDTALTRIAKRAEKLTSFEQETRIFYEKLITGYTKLYRNRKDVLVLDGTQTQDIITQKAITNILSLIS